MYFLFYIALGVVGLFGAVHASNYGPRAAARRRLRSASRELVDGSVVTLTGTIAAVETIEAPLSGRTVVAFATSARIYAGSGRSRRVVDEVFALDAKDFILETKDGRVHVEATNPA